MSPLKRDEPPLAAGVVAPFLGPFGFGDTVHSPQELPSKTDTERAAVASTFAPAR